MIERQKSLISRKVATGIEEFFKAITQHSGFVKNSCYSIKSVIETDGESRKDAYGENNGYEESKLLEYFRVYIFFSKLGSSLMAQLLWNFKASKTVSIQFRPFSNTRSKLDYGFKTNYAEIYANDCPEDECQLQKTEKQKQIDQQKAEKEKEAQRCKLKEYTASNIMVWKIYHINWNFKKENYGWKKTYQEFVNDFFMKLSSQSTI